MTNKEFIARIAFLDARAKYKSNPTGQNFEALSAAYKAYELIFNQWGH